MQEAQIIDRFKEGDGVRWTTDKGKIEYGHVVEVDNGTLIVRKENGEEFATANW